MSWPTTGTTATGNPLTVKNYHQSIKWGNDLTSKWNALNRQDPFESSANYEGENSN